MGGLYDYKWQQRRARQLRDFPLCAMCSALGRVVPAVIADHVTPHRGNAELFEGELQSLCVRCHDSAKQSLERTGRIKGCDVDGRPLDPSHWWKK